ncbi:hypothetical protein RSAG8_00217, partial [Rhizoctonia solani AG-8 WAC10335]
MHAATANHEDGRWGTTPEQRSEDQQKAPYPRRAGTDSKTVGNNTRATIRRSAESPVPKTGRDRLYPLREGLCVNDEVLILHEFDSLPTITSQGWWRADLALHEQSTSLSYTLRIVCRLGCSHSQNTEEMTPGPKAERTLVEMVMATAGNREKTLSLRDHVILPILVK